MLLALPLVLVACGDPGPTEGDNVEQHMEFACPDVIDWSQPNDLRIDFEDTPDERRYHTFPRKDGGTATVSQVPARTHEGLAFTTADCDA